MLQGDRPHLLRAGIDSVTVIGVACTDIADLYEVVVNGVRAGISFTVILVDPQSKDVCKGGIIGKWEDWTLVDKEVIKPLLKQLNNLQAEFENNADVKSKIAELVGKIEDLYVKTTDLSQHSVCITVCQELWELAGRHAMRMSHKAGTVIVLLDDELPFARQWIFGKKAVLYSAYVGYPGVGVDNPVFCYSALDEPGSDVAERALHYADQLVDKINSRGEHKPLADAG